MKTNKRIIFTLTLIILLITFPMLSFAHSGRTDSSGGHHDNKNKSGLGSYHYHHGMPAHLHPNGVCPYAPKDKITVSGYDSLMYVGDTQSFDYNIESVNSYVYPTITSSDSSIISVNGTKLTAKGTGTATITIATSTATKSFNITVQEVYAENLEISVSSDKLQIGDTIKIHNIITPNNTTNKKLTYESSNKTIATVSLDGTIKGVSSGEVTITVTTSNDISKEITLTIFEVFPAEIECDNDSINLIVGDECDFGFNILPDNANNKEFTITFENEDIFKYSDNTITALKEGSAYIHIETWNGIKKDIPIQIDIIPVETVDIVDSTKYIYSNIIDLSDNISLSTKISPNNATYQDIVWSSSNSNIVTVENNEFIVKGTGKVTLACNTHENVTDNIEIIIVNKDLIVSISAIVVFGIVTITISIFVVKRKKKS